MKTVAIISQKGGSGKSTLALHLAVASSRERDTAVIDLDPQASAASWADRREAGTPPVLSAHSSRLLFAMKEVEQAEGPQGSLVILDTAPHADRVALDAAKAADLVLIPARTTIFDIEPCLRTCELIATTKTPQFVVLNGVAAVGSEADDSARTIEAQGFAVAPVRLVSRVAYARSLMVGQVAQEFRPNDKAAKETAALHTFMCIHLYASRKETRTDGRKAKLRRGA